MHTTMVQSFCGKKSQRVKIHDHKSFIISILFTTIFYKYSKVIGLCGMDENPQMTTQNRHSQMQNKKIK